MEKSRDDEKGKKKSLTRDDTTEARVKTNKPTLSPQEWTEQATLCYRIGNVSLSLKTLRAAI